MASFAVLLAAVVAPAATVAASAVAKPAHEKPGDGAGSRLIVSPRPGQRIDSDQVRLVVRGGANRGEVRARLNGVAIGSRFLVNLDRHRRFLESSLVDGLRRGANTLTVWVERRRGGYDRARVRFFVDDRDPMVSAGRDVRIAAGTSFDLDGEERLPGSDRGGQSVRWEVVSAPPRSDLSRRPGNAAPRRAVQAAFDGRRTLDPMFRPDVLGRFKLKLTSAGSDGTASDFTTVYAVPPTPMLVLDTEVPASSAEPRPGIRIGGNVLRAPYLRTDGGVSNYGGYVEGKVGYASVWQIVVLDRSTLALKWNRTYGVCSHELVGEVFTCTTGKDGIPEAADLDKELEELKSKYLVIAASHPNPAGEEEWGQPDVRDFVKKNLGVVGFPDASDKEIGAAVAAAEAGEMAGVGVPGLKPGQATITAGAGPDGLDGYLTPDSNSPPHYTYIPRQRIPFDTRSAEECDSSTCTVTQRVGPSEVKGSIPTGKGGYLVSGFNRITLAETGHEVFATATGVTEEGGGAEHNKVGEIEVERMREYISRLVSQKVLILVTSIHGPNQPQPILYTKGTVNLHGLTEAIAAAGGTHEEFLTGISEPNGDYSLLAGPHLAEGEAQEAKGAGARLSGVFLPDDDSIYQPRSVTETNPPPETLIQIIMQAPGSEEWPDEDKPEVMKAMSAIGMRTNKLGSDPRVAYWQELVEPEDAEEALHQVEGLEFLPDQGIGEAAFAKAKKDLERELGYVQSVRTYMVQLAEPAGEGEEAWKNASEISAELQDALEKLKEQGQAASEYLALVEEALEMAGLFVNEKEFEKTVKFIQAVAIAAELGQTLWNTNYDGSSTKPSINVEALRLGHTLAEQAKANEKSFTRFGDVIVGDWAKLQVVGKYGGCNPNGSCGPHGEYEALSRTPQGTDLARTTTIRAFKRQLYSKLVPLAFPIWDTGPTGIEATKLPETTFHCSDLYHPFKGAPQLAYFKSLGALSTVSGHRTWEVYLSTARSGTVYGWPPESMLKTMFESIPLDSNDPNKPLGMNPGNFMREGIRINEYEPGPSCHWEE